MSQTATQRFIPEPFKPSAPSKTIAHRLRDANAEWNELYALACEAKTRQTPLQPALIHSHFDMFIAAIIDDAALCARISQHLNQRLIEERASRQGTLC